MFPEKPPLQSQQVGDVCGEGDGVTDAVTRLSNTTSCLLKQDTSYSFSSNLFWKAR